MLKRMILFLVLLSNAGAQEAQWPGEAPDQWLLAFVDIETTGLVPGYHEMIDLGIVLTDIAGTELDELFVRIQPQFPDRTDAGARAVNAFDEDRWRALNALTPADTIERIANFRNAAAGSRQVMLVAFNSQFDTAFLDHLYRSEERSWREHFHYFVLDVPSMAWNAGIRGLTGTNVSRTLGIEDEPHVAEMHTGITGARLNARIYRALQEYAATPTP